MNESPLLALERCRARLEELRAGFPDARLAVAELEIVDDGGEVALVGATTEAELPGRVIAALAPPSGASSIRDRVRRLPEAEELGGRTRAIVRAAWLPGRRSPSHRSEMVTQWPCGEVLELLERREEWIRARGSDGYVAWAVGGGFEPATPDAAAEWAGAASAVSLGTALAPLGTAPVPAYLPWGARAEIRPEGILRLPGGGTGRPLDPGAIAPEELRAERFPREGSAVLATASRWLGTPYVWGGRTPWGADCSGLVQSVFALHGVPLPRDSDLQRGSGRDLGYRPGEAVDFLPGDLLFFAWGGGGVSHVGIGAGGSRLLHCSETNGFATVDDLEGDSPLERRLREGLVAATRPLEPA